MNASTAAPARHRAKWRLLAVVITSALATATVITAALLRLHGVEWFVVLTPSMGQAAPVGTLVLTEPALLQHLHVGDIVSYRPQGGTTAVFTHRIIELNHAAATATARGDINTAADPYPVTNANLVGRVWLRLPGLGWVQRALPPVTLGLIVVWAITLPVQSRLWRRTLRNLGLSVIVSAFISVLKPLTNVETITTQATPHGLLARVVSTGLLPVKIDGRGDGTHLTNGAVGEVTLLPTTGAAHHAAYTLPTHLDLTAIQWVIVAAVCSIPFIVGVVDGIRHPISAPA